MSKPGTPFEKPGQAKRTEDWNRLAPKLVPALKAWIEQTARTLLASPLPADRAMAQLDAKVKQQARQRIFVHGTAPTFEEAAALILALILDRMELEAGPGRRTLELSRAVSKREQLFKTLEATLRKYNETADKVISSLGR